MRNGATVRGLVTTTATVDLQAPSLSAMSYGPSVWLANLCNGAVDGVQLASASYHVTLPSAIAYSHVGVQVGGYSLYAASSMFVGYGKGGGSSDFVIGSQYRITDRSEGYWGIGSINPSGLMTAKHVMNLGLS